MALLHEEIVVEWLNRDGWFTIRGIKVGGGEIDILAIKPTPKGVLARHVEVHVSFKPIGRVTKKGAKRRNSRISTRDVSRWIKKKFDAQKKADLKKRLFKGEWTRELVVHKVKYPDELQHIRKGGVKVHRLVDLRNCLNGQDTVVKGAAGADLVGLMMGICDEA